MSEKDKELEKELDEMAKGFLKEIQNATSEDLADTSFVKEVARLSDVDYARSMLRILDDANKSVFEREKSDLIKGIIRTSWLQRIHSTIRSLLLGLVAATILLPVLLFVGSLDLIQNILLAIPIFGSGLIVTRLLDNQIIKAAKKTVRYLSKHKKLRKFLMNYV